MKHQIIKDVEKLCEEKGVEPLFLFFTGSRAYGYNKESSDYDVLFVFKRPLKDYFSIIAPADEIRLSDVDIKGWDIKKFCQILSKSGWNAFEALHCETYVFGDHRDTLEELESVVMGSDLYDAKRIAKTMISCSMRDLKKHDEEEDDMNRKMKYFLSFTRMILSAKYCINNSKDYCPIKFDELVEKTVECQHFKEIILNIAEMRKNGEQPKKPVLHFQMDVVKEILNERRKEYDEYLKTLDFKSFDPKNLEPLNDLIFKTCLK